MSFIFPPPRKGASARWAGLRVGLMGGSFNPPHAGHLHIARQAIIQHKLDAVWWLVSPGNPLKTKAPLADYEIRLHKVTAFLGGQPRMCASDIEAQLGTRYTQDTLMMLKRHFRRTCFVWIAGMDSARSFGRWRGWNSLPAYMNFAFFERPPALSKLRGMVVRAHKSFKQFTTAKNTKASQASGCVYWHFRGKALPVSSSEIRRKHATKLN